MSILNTVPPRNQADEFEEPTLENESIVGESGENTNWNPDDFGSVFRLGGDSFQGGEGSPEDVAAQEQQAKLKAIADEEEGTQWLATLGYGALGMAESIGGALEWATESDTVAGVVDAIGDSRNKLFEGMNDQTRAELTATWAGGDNSVWSNPSAIATQLVSQLPNAIASFGPAAIVKIFGAGGKIAMGLSSGSSAATLNAGEIFNEVADEVDALTTVELMGSAAYKEMLEDGEVSEGIKSKADQDKVRKQFKNEIANQPMLITGMVSMALGGASAANVVGAGAKTWKGVIGKGALEGVSEGAEEGTAGLSTESALVSNDLKEAIDYGRVIEQTAAGAGLGGVQGTGVNALTKNRENAAAKARTAETDSLISSVDELGALQQEDASDAVRVQEEEKASALSSETDELIGTVDRLGELQREDEFDGLVQQETQHTRQTKAQATRDSKPPSKTLRKKIDDYKKRISEDKEGQSNEISKAIDKMVGELGTTGEVNAFLLDIDGAMSTETGKLSPKDLALAFDKRISAAVEKKFENSKLAPKMKQLKIKQEKKKWFEGTGLAPSSLAYNKKNNAEWKANNDKEIAQAAKDKREADREKAAADAADARKKAADAREADREKAAAARKQAKEDNAAARKQAKEANDAAYAEVQNTTIEKEMPKLVRKFNKDPNQQFSVRIPPDQNNNRSKGSVRKIPKKVVKAAADVAAKEKAQSTLSNRVDKILTGAGRNKKSAAKRVLNDADAKGLNIAPEKRKSLEDLANPPATEAVVNKATANPASTENATKPLPKQEPQGEKAKKAKKLKKGEQVKPAEDTKEDVDTEADTKQAEEKPKIEVDDAIEADVEVQTVKFGKETYSVTAEEQAELKKLTLGVKKKEQMHEDLARFAFETRQDIKKNGALQQGETITFKYDGKEATFKNLKELNDMGNELAAEISLDKDRITNITNKVLSRNKKPNGKSKAPTNRGSKESDPLVKRMADKIRSFKAMSIGQAVDLINRPGMPRDMRRALDTLVTLTDALPMHIRASIGAIKIVQTEGDSYYNQNTGEIVIHVGGKSDGDVILDLIHELSHGATIPALEAEARLGTGRLARLLDNVYSSYLKHAIDGGDKFSVTNYGILNQKEFIAEYVSNPEFRDMVDNHKKGTSPLAKMKSWVKRVFAKLTGIKGIDPMNDMRSILSGISSTNRKVSTIRANQSEALFKGVTFESMSGSTDTGVNFKLSAESRAKLGKAISEWISPKAVDVAGQRMGRTLSEKNADGWGAAMGKLLTRDRNGAPRALGFRSIDSVARKFRDKFPAIYRIYRNKENALAYQRKLSDLDMAMSESLGKFSDNMTGAQRETFGRLAQTASLSGYYMSENLNSTDPKMSQQEAAFYREVKREFAAMDKQSGNHPGSAYSAYKQLVEYYKNAHHNNMGTVVSNLLDGLASDIDALVKRNPALASKVLVRGNPANLKAALEKYNRLRDKSNKGKALTDMEKDFLKTAAQNLINEVAKIKTDVFAKELDKTTDKDARKALEAEMASIERAVSGSVGAIKKVFGYGMIKGDYLPATRDGDFQVAVYSTKAEDIKKFGANNADTPQATVVFMAFKSRAEQEAAIKEMSSGKYAGSEYSVQPMARTSVGNSNIANLGALGHQIDLSLKRLGNSEAQRDSVETALRMLLNENSMRAHSLNRKNVLGADTNVIGHFNKTAYRNSWIATDLKFGKAFNEDMKGLAAHASKGNNIADQVLAKRLYEMVLAKETQHAEQRDRESIGSKIQQGGATLGYVYYLANPSYALLNITQSFLTSAPVLSARYGGAVVGQAKMMKAIGQSLKSTVDYYRNDIKNSFSLTNSSSPAEFILNSMKKDGSITKAEFELVQAMIDNGTIDSTATRDLMEQATSDYDRTRLQTMGAKALNSVRAFTSSTEAANRIASVLALHRLESAKPARAKLGYPMDQKGLEDYAKDFIDETQFNYAAHNKGKILSGPIGSLLLMFQTYAVGMIDLLGKNFINMFDKTADRKVAAKTFFGVFGMHVALGGVAATMLPVIHLAAWAALQAFGDEEEEGGIKSPDLWLMQAVTETIGDNAMADVVKYGLPGLVGANMSGSITMSDMGIPRLPDFSGNTSEWFAQSVVAVLGPIGGIGGSIAKGIDYGYDGQAYKGIETALPKFARSAMRSYREAGEGVTDRSGDVVLDASEISMWDTMLSGLSINTAARSNAWNGNRVVNTHENAVKNSKARITKLAVRALNRGEKAEFKEIVAEMKELNKVLPKKARMELYDLYDSFNRFQKRKLKLIHGAESTYPEFFR